MPVAALCEKGLIADVFGQNPFILKCQAFECKKNTMVAIFSNKLQFITLPGLQVEKEIEIFGISTSQLSENGQSLGVLLHTKDLHVFHNANAVYQIQDGELFSISDSFYSVSTENKTQIFNYTQKEPVFESKSPVKSLFAFNTLVFMVSERENEVQKLFMFRNGVLSEVLVLPNIYRAVIKSTDDEKQFTLVIDVEYTKNSYYAESSLFFLSFINFDQCISICDQTNTSANEVVPSLFTKKDQFIVLHYKNLIKIHQVEFLRNSFYVCHGNQPASLSQFNLTGKLQKKYPNAIRNTVIFNSKEKRVINAGLGNLPGIIEIFDDGKSTCSFEKLGASVVKWINNGSHFMVATTNYFKSQNGIAIYDYYGRLLEEMECKSLVSVCVYGDPEDEVTVTPPKETIRLKPAALYVPPHLINRNTTPTAQKTIAKKRPNKKPSAPEKTKETIKKELDECLKLRERLRNGEELSLEEENRVFKIRHLEEELKKKDL